MTTERGQVTASMLADCGSPSAGDVLTAAAAPGIPGGGTCAQAMFAIDTGPNAGAGIMPEFSRGPGQPNPAAGQTIPIFRQVDPQDATSYGFYHSSAAGRWPYWPCCSPS